MNQAQEAGPDTPAEPRRGQALTRSSHCRICNHPRRAELETMLRAGLSQVAVAAAAGVHQASVCRHVAHHVPLSTAAIERAAGRLLPKLVLEAEEPAVRLTEVREALWRGMQAAETAKELKTLPRFGRELARCLELELRYGGADPPADNGVVSEQRGAIKALGAVLLAALADFPEARERAAHAIASLDATGSRS